MMMKKKKSVFREYAETIISAFIIAMVIRTFVVEPFKIPTGSMEPTLHGDPKHGDRIFVNKFIYRFKEPVRGDIIVFTTKNIPGLGKKKNYIKRLIGLPGETIKIKHGDIYINDEPVTLPVIDKNIYSNSEPRAAQWQIRKKKIRIPEPFFLIKLVSDDSYYLLSTLIYDLTDELKPGDRFNFNPQDIYGMGGVVSVEVELVAEAGQIIKLRKDGLYVDDKIYTNSYDKEKFYVLQGQYGMPDQEIKIPDDAYYVLGDNSAISKDSRFWGIVPKKSLKGKSMFIWWPPKRWQVTR